jgi:hypothetical protein
MARNPDSIKMVYDIDLRTHLPEFPVTQFHFHKEDKTFSQEASSLEIAIGTVYPLIRLVNPKTQGVRTYMHRKTLMDASGEDIGGWEYYSIDGLKLIVWND